MLQLLIKLS